MAKFYFDVYLGFNFFPDEHGIDLETLDIVEEEATRRALEIARHQILKAGISSVRIKVKNDRQQNLLTAAVSMTVDKSRAVLESNPKSGPLTVLDPISGNIVRLAGP